MIVIVKNDQKQHGQYAYIAKENSMEHDILHKVREHQHERSPKDNIDQARLESLHCHHIKG
jgi:hypothetical protein